MKVLSVNVGQPRENPWKTMPSELKEMARWRTA
jgi:hypothetical protein